MGDIGRTGRRLTMLALMGLVAVLAFWAFFGSTSADYVGSEKCGDCHDGNYDDWAATWHGIEFSTWDYHGEPTNKYTYAGGNDTTGAFGGCASCHVVGWGDTENGGTKTDEPWNSTHNLPLGSIGCENCHGPGSGHVDDRSGNPEYMNVGEFAYSLSCAGWNTVANDDRPEPVLCHDGGRMGGIPDEEIPGYYDSGHAGGIGPSSPKGNPGCYHCMAANGFISVTIEGGDAPEADDFVMEGDDYFVDGELVVYGIYCGVCHDPHPDADAEHIDYQLRAPEDEICELCHYNTHVFPDTHVRHPTTEFRNGINGKDVPVIEFMADVHCPECHMWGTGHRDPEVFVGHDFQINPQSCVACHSMYTNETAEEWIDGVHAEFAALQAPFTAEGTGILAEVEERHEWAMANGLWDEETNMTYLEAEWNYEYPSRDGSNGAHNPPFMRAMWASAAEKFEEVMMATAYGGVEGTLTWDDATAIAGAKIMDGTTTMATTDDNGTYFFWTMAGSGTFTVMDADGELLGVLSVDATVMQNVTMDETFTKEVVVDPPDDDDDDDGDGFDTMHYAFIGIIVLLVIILVVVSMMGKKE